MIRMSDDKVKRFSTAVANKLCKKLKQNPEIEKKYETKENCGEFKLEISGGVIGRADIGFKSKNEKELLLIEIDAPGNPIRNAVKILTYVNEGNSKKDLKVFHFYSPDFKSKKENTKTGGEIIFEKIVEWIPTEKDHTYTKCLDDLSKDKRDEYNKSKNGSKREKIIDTIAQKMFDEIKLRI